MPALTPKPPEGGLNSRLRVLKPPSGGLGVSGEFFRTTHHSFFLTLGA
jgi:hypothetical protein